MRLSVYSLKKTVFQGEAKAINCKTAMGEITVLEHHEPLISELTPGVMKITDGAGVEHFASVAGGFLEVQGKNLVRAIVEET